MWTPACLQCGGFRLLWRGGSSRSARRPQPRASPMRVSTPLEYAVMAYLNRDIGEPDIDQNSLAGKNRYRSQYYEPAGRPARSERAA